MKVQSLKNKTWIADSCILANSFFGRLKGLLGTRIFNPGQGLLLEPCNDIHMWFMAIPLDIVFVRRVSDAPERFIVTSAWRDIRPWRFLPLRDGKATATFELPVGTITRCEIQPGDILCLS